MNKGNALIIGVLLIGLIGGAIVIFGNKNTANLPTYEYSYEGDSEICYEPENTYHPESGHYAGFEWAMDKNVNYCGGNSRSFIEGCQEFVDQKNLYISCMYTDNS